ncbi:hypothetical protein VNO77_07274 [Canavalia gladiata]|uniref:RPW8 domain-containing protein n=1 Tax=Canavalia gladiata TaxID=3824 RepID=A0AAN9M888_CANGL
MAEIVGGAVFGELLNTILKKKNNAIMFKSTLENIRSILEALDPLIKEIAQQNNDLDLPKKQLERLISEMKKGTKLISKCSQIHKLNYLAKIRYQRKLKVLLDSLYMLFSIEVLAQLARDQKETLLMVKRIHNKLSFEMIEDATSSDGTEIHDSVEIQLAEKSALGNNVSKIDTKHTMMQTDKGVVEA